MRLLAGVAGLALAVLHVGRHPATRRLSEDAVDACEYCERLTRDWETRVCRILSDTNSIHAGELSGRKARYVVVVEFHSGIIEDAFSRHGLRFRSPFGLR